MFYAEKYVPSTGIYKQNKNRYIHSQQASRNYLVCCVHM